MQLTPEQIQHLFTFTEKKYVHWYDLQVELVDHLASRIEDEMESDPSLSFDSALGKVYKGFGISGFSKVVEEKSTQLYRQAGKIWWKEFLLFFKWPKIILLLTIFAVLWLLSSMFEPGPLFLCFAGADFLIGLVLVFYRRKAYKVKRRLLLLQVGPGSSPSSILIYQSFVLCGLIGNFNIPDITSLVFCIYPIIAILIRFATMQVHFKVKEKARMLYPDAFA